MSEDKSPYISVHEIAERFEVTPGTVYKWIREGHLPAARFAGRVVRVRRSDLEAFEASALDRGSDPDSGSES